MEDRAEAADGVAVDARAVIHDHAGDQLTRAAAEDARFRVVAGETFVIGDVADARQHVADFFGRVVCV